MSHRAANALITLSDRLLPARRLVGVRSGSRLPRRRAASSIHFYLAEAHSWRPATRSRSCIPGGRGPGLPARQIQALPGFLPVPTAGARSASDCFPTSFPKGGPRQASEAQAHYPDRLRTPRHRARRQLKTLRTRLDARHCLEAVDGQVEAGVPLCRRLVVFAPRTRDRQARNRHEQHRTASPSDHPS